MKKKWLDENLNITNTQTHMIYLYTYISLCEVTTCVLEVRSYLGQLPIVHFRMTIKRVTPNYSEDNLSLCPFVKQNTFCTALRQDSGRLCENLTINRQSQNNANYSILLVFLAAGNIYTESDNNFETVLDFGVNKTFGLLSK
jgi:hypothetical protein